MTYNDIKYKAIFGDMAQFNGMMPDCEFVDGTYGYKRVGKAFYYCERHNEKHGWSLSKKLRIDFRPIAMRSIIKEPKRWTWEDKKVGRLPEVGSIFTYRDETLTCHFIDGDGEIWAHDIDNKIVTPLLRDCKPIETPREKYDRERDECIDKLLAKVTPMRSNQTYGMKIMYEELRPFTGDNHD